MAEASSSSKDTLIKHDVFLSFSGEDTRQGFTNTLYHYLQKTKGIETFIENQLPRGQQIQASLMTIIETSRIAVIIFSEKYASSSWCLDELVKINESNLTIIPIFYKVEPEHVLKQVGKFGDEFTKLKSTHTELEITKWSNVLASTATLSGFVLANYSTEIDLVKDVAADILKKLDFVSSPVSILPHLVGVNTIIDDLHKLITSESSRVQFLGIYGMSGIGKTTIAELLYHQLSRQFDECNFVILDFDAPINVLVILRNKIISKILGEEISEHTPSQPSIGVLLRLQKKKVLIVLDNISNKDQVTTLVGTKANPWFASGSKIIVTSRDSNVFENEGMDVYGMKEMNKQYTLNLFCLHAFKQYQPPDDEEYVQLSAKMVKYAEGLPLALKVLGSELFGRPKDQWRSILEHLKRSMKPGIRQVLETGYRSLEEMEQKIFIEIACFFKGHDKDKLQYILDGYGLPAAIGIARLIEKCLVTVRVDSGRKRGKNKIEMHDLLQQMGWEIAEEQSRANLGIRNRFWKFTDSYELLSSYQAVRATSREKEKIIEGIFLNINEDEIAVRKLSIHPMTFRKMQNLKVLKFYKSKRGLCFSSPNVEVFWYLPNSLRYLQWDGFPHQHLPSDFSAENLVELKLRGSNLRRLWMRVEGSMNLKSLKILNLSYSYHLISLPDLSSFAINLKQIILNFCKSLCEIPSSIQYLKDLSILSLKFCSRLDSLPSLVNIRSLKKLHLQGSEHFTKFPETSGEIEELDLRGTSITKWPNSMSCLDNLKFLKLPYELQEFPCTLHLNSLEVFSFKRFYKVQILPEIKGGIRKLKLPPIQIKELPPWITLLRSLVELDLSFCVELQGLPDNFDQLNCLEKLKLSRCMNLSKVPLTLSGLYSIKVLLLDGCGLRRFPTWICTLSSLQTLDLSYNDFVNVPDDIRQLSSLESLDLSWCKNLRSLPAELPPRIQILRLIGCKSLELESSSFIKDGELRKLFREDLELSGHEYQFRDCTGLGEDARRDSEKCNDEN